MLKFFVISKSKQTVSAIADAVKLRYSLNDKQVHLIFERDEEATKENLELFYLFFESIEKELISGDFVHDRFIGILDLPDIANVGMLHAFTSVPGMLILAFPEIQWIPLFREAMLWSSFDENAIMTLDRAVTLCKGGYSPLFDGDGLRSVLLERAHRGKYDQNHLQYSRTDVAFAIDEESSFACMNAYTAYRFGYRAFPVSSKVSMDELLGKDKLIPYARGMSLSSNPRFVVFEDIYLEFPDADRNYNDYIIAFGDKRVENFPLLKDADLRVITTAADDNEKVVDHRKNIAEYFKKIRWRKQISKQPHWRLQTLLEHFLRYLFNLWGGFWPGFWLINLIKVTIIATLLIGVFFLYPAGFFPLLFLVFIIFGLMRQSIHAIIQKKSLFIPWFSALLRHRGQWAFMPKKYENHCPIAFSANNKYWEIAHKPLAGIFGLRNKCQLPNGRNYSLLFASKEIKKIYKTVLKPVKLSLASSAGENSHAAPGVALELATLLLRRAERMKGGIIDAEGAIHAAVLANVALELLNFKTPAVAIEALKWKHYYEIFAECNFIGVRARVDMKERYIDIHNSMWQICCSETNGTVRESVFLSGMAELIDQLAKLLRDNGKLEEAAYFTIHSRRLHRKLMPVFPRSVLAYPEWVLRSQYHFLASFSCFFGLFLSYLIVNKLSLDMSNANPSIWDFCVTAYQVMIFRMNVTMPTAQDQLIVLLARQIAMLHLGFVSAYFLMFMNRK